MCTPGVLLWGEGEKERRIERNDNKHARTSEVSKK